MGGRVFKNFESRGYGPIDLHKALVVSCDTVFYRLAYAAWQAQGGIAAPPGARDPFVADGAGPSASVGPPASTCRGSRPAASPTGRGRSSTGPRPRHATCRRASTGYPEVARTDQERAAYLKRLAVENCPERLPVLRPGDAANFSIGQGDIGVPRCSPPSCTPRSPTAARWQPQVAAAYAPRGTGDGHRAAARRPAPCALDVAPTCAARS